jgi:hypothetical protein
MRVAVLFAGRVRAYEAVTRTLEDVKGRYGPTYYCSLNQAVYDDYIDGFCKLLDISRDRINIEPTPNPGFFSKIHNYTSKSPEQAYSMFYHENKAFSLIEKDVTENNMRYDCVVYTRADIKSEDSLQLEMPKPNTIYVPIGNDYEGINDRMAYGDFDSMKKYCSIIDNLTSPQSMNGTNPEGIIKSHLERHSLQVIRFKYDTTLSNQRKNLGDKV